MLKFPLAVLKHHNSALMEMDLEEVRDYFQSFQFGMAKDKEDLLKSANRIKITTKKLDVLKQLFEDTCIDVNDEKPIRRLLVIPEIKDEDDSDNGEQGV
jgi:hypothetical protein